MDIFSIINWLIFTFVTCVSVWLIFIHVYFLYKEGSDGIESKMIREDTRLIFTMFLVNAMWVTSIIDKSGLGTITCSLCQLYLNSILVKYIRTREWPV